MRENRTYGSWMSLLRMLLGREVNLLMRMVSISFLRTLAALIIINSHCSALYPMTALACGGAFGNSLFFLMSGFLLANIKLDFFSWIKKRYIRLYIPIFLLGIILLLLGKESVSLYSVVFRLIFPEHRWFVCALIIMYPLFYFVNKKKLDVKKYIYCSIVLLLIYIYIYCEFLDTSQYVVEKWGNHGVRFSYIFSFFLMITGCMLRLNLNKIIDRVKLLYGGDFWIYTIAVMSLVAYFSFMFFMNKYKVLYQYQFMETLLCIGATLGIFVSCVINEERFRNIRNKFFAKFLLIGEYTLEIYLLQFLIIEFAKKYLDYFPVSVFFVYVMTISIAVIFNKIVKLMNGKLQMFIV